MRELISERGRGTFPFLLKFNRADLLILPDFHLIPHFKNVTLTTNFATTGWPLASWVDVLWACHAFLPYVGKECVTSPKNVCVVDWVVPSKSQLQPVLYIGDL